MAGSIVKALFVETRPLPRRPGGIVSRLCVVRVCAVRPGSACVAYKLEG